MTMKHTSILGDNAKIEFKLENPGVPSTCSLQLVPDRHLFPGAFHDLVPLLDGHVRFDLWPYFDLSDDLVFAHPVPIEDDDS